MFIAALLLLLFFAKYVPLNMDEFCHYHALACQYYPLNKLNTFREACNAYDLAPLPNLYLPLRSYSYEGIVQCLLYYPLFLLWHSPFSARFLGLIMLGLQAFLLNKLFRTNILISFVFLLSYMPYAFQHIVDTGPVTFQTTSVFLIYYLSKQWITFLKEDKKHSWLYPLSIGAVIFLGIWSKLVYFAMLPALLLMVLYPLFYLPSKLKVLIRDLLVLAAAALIPSFLLLNAVDRYGLKYSLTLHASKNLSISDLSKIQELFRYFSNPLMSAHRIFKFDGAPPVTAEGILLIFIAVVFAAWGIALLRLRKIKTSFFILNLICFLMTFFLISRSQSAWAMHHVVLSMPFLVIAFFYLFSKVDDHKFKVLFAIFFIAANLSLYQQLTRLQYNEPDHPSKYQLNELLNKDFSDKYVFIVIDWGMYYIKSLYGKKDQCVLYIEPLNDQEEIREIKEILNKTKRKALFIGKADSESDLELIKRNFPSLLALNAPSGAGAWQVLYEK